MARALIDRNRAREARRQGLLLDRLAGQFRARIEHELASAMRVMIDGWEQTHAVLLPQGFRTRLEILYAQMATAAVEAFGGRILDQGKAAGLILERKEDFGTTMRRLALDYVQQEAVRRRITDVTETTRRQIISAVDKGYRDGQTTAEISRNLRGFVGGVASYNSADLIQRARNIRNATYNRPFPSSDMNLVGRDVNCGCGRKCLGHWGAGCRAVGDWNALKRLIESCGDELQDPAIDDAFTGTANQNQRQRAA